MQSLLGVSVSPLLGESIVGLRVRCLLPVPNQRICEMRRLIAATRACERYGIDLNPKVIGMTGGDDVCATP